MHTLAMILLLMGIVLVVVAIFVFFTTDCKTIFRSLVTTRPIPLKGGLDRNSVKNIYYTNQAFNLFNRSHQRNKEKKSEDDIFNNSAVLGKENEQKTKSESEALAEVINVDSGIINGDEKSHEKKDSK